MFSVAIFKACWFLGPASPAQCFGKFWNFSDRFGPASEEFSSWWCKCSSSPDTQIPSPSGILSIDTTVRKMQHILKRELQYLSTNYFLFSSPKSVNGFLVKKFSPSKLKSAADMCFPKVLSIQNLSSLQQKWLVVTW